jgi:integrative and conjugative element protein (TIGR02256 family)
VNVWLEPAALVTILSEAQRSKDRRETGGLLIGFETDGGLLVALAGEPGPNAVRRRNFFLRDLKFADELLSCAFDRTGAVWVGDWHTHPGYSDRPSSTDTNSYMQLLSDDELQFEAFLAIIVTSTSGTFCDAKLSPWVATPEGVARARLML